MGHKALASRCLLRALLSGAGTPKRDCKALLLLRNRNLTTKKETEGCLAKRGTPVGNMKGEAGIQPLHSPGFLAVAKAWHPVSHLACVDPICLRLHLHLRGRQVLFI